MRQLIVFAAPKKFNQLDSSHLLSDLLVPHLELQHQQREESLLMLIVGVKSHVIHLILEEKEWM
jgi:hypothetical protein